MAAATDGTSEMSTNGYRALFDGAPDAIVLADLASGRIERANAAAAALFERAGEALVGCGLSELFDAAAAARLAALAVEADPGRPIRIADARVRTASGRTRPVDICAAVVAPGTRPVVEIVLRDDTERRLAEAELREARARLEAQNAELRLAQARLIEIDRVRSEFLGMMSHELRTPVNILIGYTHMLLESVAAGESLPAHERAGILRRMIAGGHTLSELVEDTLSVLRLDGGAARLDLEPVALDTLFHDLKGNDRLLRGDGAVEERWVVEPDVPEIVTDRRKLRQVVTNLVGNARKFTRQGFVEVRARVPSPGRVSISVTDTGCGIGAEELPRVFELYRQVNNGLAHDGCGIGLYIVRRYVEMLQGRVHCTSTLGKGSVFTIELPRHVDMAEGPSASARADAAAAMAG
jgi:PAS domain S-box-containing protein